MNVLIHDASNQGATRLALHPQWVEADGVATLVNVSYQGTNLLVSFHVKEPQLRRMCTHHNDAVWTDSCVEVFLKRPDQAEYVNFEFSAAGFCHVARGTGRSGRQSYPDAGLASVPLQVRILENTLTQSRWDLSVTLDLSRFGLVEEGGSLKGKILFGNFYKCGDGLEKPHYLSYAPIDTDQPDFHRPEAFVPFQFV
ncbi:MAG: hypothetical protein LKE39_08040 [Sphaerochaeta sp.]|jgi:hypothetical protein|nr:hypothetical protein [Sphaerochaeta sp.]MCH3920396.1 hypothetical protein [Sphaerochaeta sp.]MCI2044958.1 carbohydrate-binding family 9-like protein [Sphaerochaeta sp.]MCI2076297.1 carbohydrate-binding family 9-like protein [Sphaerochaeta sp.]MCI2096543.1 carbohydrate-binding family 9-like protein [Sphaerochaeta sp.]